MPDAAKSPSRLGRTAALVQGLGLLSAGIVAAALLWMDMQSGEGYAIVGVGSAAACVFLFWSLMLAIRAITGGERGNWPLIIVLLTLLEIGLPCLALWSEVLEDHHNTFLNFLIWLGLPVFGPFVAIGSLIAAPIALRRARKSDAAESAAGVKSWQRKTWKVWLAWYAGVMAALGIFLLPGPLFLLGATAQQFYSFEEYDGDELVATNWGQVIARKTPNFIRDSVEASVVHVDSCFEIWKRIIGGGAVSETRLIERLGDSSHNGEASVAAWQALEKFFPSLALDCADKIGRDQIFSGVMERAAKRMARAGSTLQIRYFLDPSHIVHPVFRFGVLENLDGNEGLAEMTPELEKLMEFSPEGKWRSMIFGYIASYSPAPEVQRLWSKYLTQSNQQLREDAAALVFMCVQQNNVAPAIEYLSHSDLNIRRATLVGLACHMDSIRPREFRDPKDAAHLRLTRMIMTMLDDADVVLVLAASCVLGDIFQEDVGNNWRAETIAILPELLKVRSAGTARNGDRNIAGIVKSAVAKWLKENAPEK